MKWKYLNKKFNSSLKDALQQQHYAIQLIALAGKYLIAQKKDDSNTNMQYFPEMEMMIGNPLDKGYRVAVHLGNMYLMILDNELEILKQFALEGKSFTKAYDQLKNTLKDLDIDISPLKNELHYKIESHPLALAEDFKIDDIDDFIENASIRNNTEMILHDISKQLNLNTEIKVWPHHFDTGAFIPMSTDEKGELKKSMGLGFAIPDTMIKEPYFYISFWADHDIPVLKKLQDMKTGQWMMPQWNGAVLRYSDIIKATSAVEQYQIVKDFFDSGIQYINSIFNQ